MHLELPKWRLGEVCRPPRAAVAAAAGRCLTELTLAAAAVVAAAAGRCLTELTLAVQKLSVTNARPPLDSNIFLHFYAELSDLICVVLLKSF